MHNALDVFFGGFYASIRIERTLLFIVASRLTAIRTLQCVTLNGLIFLGSILVFDYVLKPGILLLGGALRHLHFEILSDDLVSDQENLLKYWKYGEDGVEKAVEVIFTFAWLLPMYTISFILNTVWYRDIAEQG
jgi:etoposide-induced 2.4 mRNA